MHVAVFKCSHLFTLEENDTEEAFLLWHAAMVWLDRVTGAAPSHSARANLAEPLHDEQTEQQQVQRAHICSRRPLQPVQVLLQSVLPSDLSFPVRTRTQGRLPLHLHCPAGLRAHDHTS